MIRTSLILALLFAGTARSEEQFNYKVDAAALAAQNRAIQKLKVVAQRFKGNYRQQILLVRLVEAQQAAAKLEFRLAHGKAQLKKTKLSLKSYHRRLETVIASTTELIVRFPQSQWLESMVLTRSKSYKELGQKEMARRDLQLVSEKAPGTEWSVQANLGLGELAIENGDYPGAIRYLSQIEQMPKDPRYPFALYQIGWAYFNLDQVPKAVDYLQRQIQHYQEKEEEQEKLSSADQALKEQSLRDLVAFYFSRLDKGDPAFPLKSLYSKIKSWESKAYFGKMALHFAKLLISRDRLSDLEQWTSQMVDKEEDRPETLELAGLFFQYSVEKKKKSQLGKAEQFLTDLKSDNPKEFSKNPSTQPTLERLLECAANLQGEIQKNKNKNAGIYHEYLTTVFRTYETLTEPDDPKLVQIKYNLAEINFAEKDYSLAADQFRWLITNGGKTPPLAPEQASLKAIVSGFQLLDAKNEIPKEIAPAAPDGDDDPDFDALSSAQAKWVREVYAHLDTFDRKPAEFVTFEFEAYRILYAHGQTKAALEGITEMVEAAPQSSVAMPAANLALDSHLLSGGEKALDVVDRFKGLKGLAKKDFATRLTDVPAEVSFRLMEKHFQEEDYDRTLSLSKDYLDEFKANQWTPHVLWIASRSAMEKKNPVLALTWLTTLLKDYPRAENRGAALLTRASLREEAYDFDGAAQDYLDFFQRPGTKAAELKTFGPRLFLSAWLASQWRPLDCTPFQKNDDLGQQCEQTRGLQFLNPGARTAKEAEQRARKGTKDQRGVWAAVALKQQLPKLSFDRRLSFSKTLVDQWNKLDALVQFSLIPILNQDVPAAFATSQGSLTKVARLKSDTKALVRRINLIKKLEDTAGEVIDLPWGQVKVAVLGSVGETYGDFCAELIKLPTPKDLSPDEIRQYKGSINEVLTPFTEKRDAIRKQVKELAGKSPVLNQGLPPFVPKPSRKLASVDQSDALLKQLLSISPSDAQRVQSLWLASLSEKHWGRVGFFLRELKDRFDVAESILTTMRAVSLFRSGAHPEAIGELEGVQGKLPTQLRQLAKTTLAGWYARSTQPDKALKLAGGESKP